MMKRQFENQRAQLEYTVPMALEFTTSYIQDSLSRCSATTSGWPRARCGELEVTDEQLFAAIDKEANSIAVIVKHMAGNMLSRWTDFLTTDGEKSTRDRDSEFIAPPGTRSQLMALWEDGWSRLFAAIEPLSLKPILAAPSRFVAKRTPSCRPSTVSWRTIPITLGRLCCWRNTSLATAGNRSACRETSRPISSRKEWQPENSASAIEGTIGDHHDSRLMWPRRGLGGPDSLGSLVKWAKHEMTNYPFDLSKRPRALKIPKGGFTAGVTRQMVRQGRQGNR